MVSLGLFSVSSRSLCSHKIRDVLPGICASSRRRVYMISGQLLDIVNLIIPPPDPDVLHIRAVLYPCMVRAHLQSMQAIIEQAEPDRRYIIDRIILATSDLYQGQSQNNSIHEITHSFNNSSFQQLAPSKHRSFPWTTDTRPFCGLVYETGIHALPSIPCELRRQQSLKKRLLE
jgi:hypothetical protein